MSLPCSLPYGHVFLLFLLLTSTALSTVSPRGASTTSPTSTTFTTFARTTATSLPLATAVECAGEAAGYGPLPLPPCGSTLPIAVQLLGVLPEDQVQEQNRGGCLEDAKICLPSTAEQYSIERQGPHCVFPACRGDPCLSHSDCIGGNDNSNKNKKNHHNLFCLSACDTQLQSRSNQTESPDCPKTCQEGPSALCIYPVQLPASGQGVIIDGSFPQAVTTIELWHQQQLLASIASSDYSLDLPPPSSISLSITPSPFGLLTHFTASLAPPEPPLPVSTALLNLCISHLPSSPSSPPATTTSTIAAPESTNSDEHVRVEQLSVRGAQSTQPFLPREPLSSFAARLRVSVATLPGAEEQGGGPVAPENVRLLLQRVARGGAGGAGRDALLWLPLDAVRERMPGQATNLFVYQTVMAGGEAAADMFRGPGLWHVVGMEADRPDEHGEVATVTVLESSRAWAAQESHYLVISQNCADFDCRDPVADACKDKDGSAGLYPAAFPVANACCPACCQLRDAMCVPAPPGCSFVPEPPRQGLDGCLVPSCGTLNCSFPTTTSTSAPDVAVTHDCAPGLTWSDAILACKDLDECAQSQSVCGAGATCQNTHGSYHCSCENGYALSHGRDCEHVAAGNGRFLLVLPGLNFSNFDCVAWEHSLVDNCAAWHGRPAATRVVRTYQWKGENGNRRAQGYSKNREEKQEEEETGVVVELEVVLSGWRGTDAGNEKEKEKEEKSGGQGWDAKTCEEVRSALDKCSSNISGTSGDIRALLMGVGLQSTDHEGPDYAQVTGQTYQQNVQKLRAVVISVAIIALVVIVCIATCFFHTIRRISKTSRVSQDATMSLPPCPESSSLPVPEQPDSAAAGKVYNFKNLIFLHQPSLGEM
eukprot:g11592.t1